MPASRFTTPIIVLLLASLMAATRLNHFGALPDASWAVFFVAGFYLQAQLRWVFPALMALAVAVDYVVISNAGLDFWSHYCVSPGYWFLLPAHFAMWIGGAALARGVKRGAGTALALLAPCLVASVVLCHLFAQGGFYWFSSSWFVDGASGPTAAGWLKNYLDWLPAYLTSTAIYVGAIAVLHVCVKLAIANRAAASPSNR